MPRLAAAAARTSARKADGPRLAEAKLVLAEFLLVCEDLAECAQRALEWLAAHCDVARGVCLTPAADNARLVAVAGHGVPPGRLLTLAFDLAGRDDAVVRAFLGGVPVTLPRSLTATERLKGLGAPVLAVPLPVPSPPNELPGSGLLLLTPGSRSITAEAGWLADVLGPALARLRHTANLEEQRRRLEHERTLLQRVINAVPDPILLTDTNGRILAANSRAEALLAASEDESEGRRRAIALNNMLFSASLSWTALPGDTPLRRELLLVDPSDGSDLLFELMGTVASDPTHGTGIVSVLRNVSDLRRATEEIEENYRKLRGAEAEVRAERDRLDLIIDSVADPIVVADPSGAIILMNAPAERLFTVGPDARDEVVARVGANDAHFSSFVSNLLFAGQAVRHRGEMNLADPETGATLPVEALAGKILSEHAELIGVVTILHDRTEALERERLYDQLKQASTLLEEKVREATTELIRQNELLRRQHIELEQASALKSQFLANMSHELRTPLNAILGYTSLLLHGVAGPLDTEQKRHLMRVDSNGRHLLSIINDILDISRIEAGKMPMHLGDFTLPELITEVRTELEPLIARSQLSIKNEVREGLPTVHSDRQKVKQIVLNLLSNALKFTPNGWVKISTGFDRATEHVVIAVQDSGIGIAESDHEKIFEDFRQADDSTTRQYGGAGLGLSICRRLASMLDGAIELKSSRGDGSTFTLRFPRTVKEAR